MIDDSKIEISKETYERAFKKKQHYNLNQVISCLNHLASALFHAKNVERVEFTEQEIPWMNTLDDFHQYIDCSTLSKFIEIELSGIMDTIYKKNPEIMKKINIEAYLPFGKGKNK